MATIEQYTSESVELLRKMIATPSVSRDESAVADLIQEWMTSKGLNVNRKGNNLWLCSEDCENGKPVVLLNSHIDTVKPAAGYTRDPFAATIENGRLYGLGSNDAGGPMVSLLAAYRYLTQTEQPYRLIYLASCEEEVSGRGGIESVIPDLGKIDLAIVGEPTKMQMAVAEKGLMVLDCVAHGKSGHAARNEGVNAIYEALPGIEWFRTHRFERESPFLGPVKMSVTQIEAGTQHNVVPDTCKFVVDVRVNEMYKNAELLELIKSSVACDVKERSTRLNSSAISMDHPIVKRGGLLGLTTFGSPTMSDQALMPFTSIKIGPGDSARSHTADEYIELKEIEDGIKMYIDLLSGLNM
ncbi:MAG: M20 family metallo-hydrolase [Bacteroidales bacterium]|nr:M20 family metallo-hydrolase [Bacteroidales bacterium]